jgi:hypothetical protein
LPISTKVNKKWLPGQKIVAGIIDLRHGRQAGERLTWARTMTETSHPVTLGPRRQRERETLAAMFHIYCQGHHRGPKTLCPACQEELDYCLTRLAKCRYGEEKPTCKLCPVHCYPVRMRERAREVMRFAGPRMLWQHPLLALRHWWEGRRTADGKSEIRNPKSDTSTKASITKN